MKLINTTPEFNVLFQNASHIAPHVAMRLRDLPNRFEISFISNGCKFPFLFRVNKNGTGCHFTSFPHFLEYSRAVNQLPDELRKFVLDLRELPQDKAVNFFQLREYWRLAK